MLAAPGARCHNKTSAYTIPHFRFETRARHSIIAQRQQETRLSGAPRRRGGYHPMGGATSDPVRLSFNPQLRVELRGATATSDASLLVPRELDERLGLGALIEQHLVDRRTGHNRQFPLSDLVRQS